VLLLIGNLRMQAASESNKGGMRRDLNESLARARSTFAAPFGGYPGYPVT